MTGPNLFSTELSELLIAASIDYWIIFPKLDISNVKNIQYSYKSENLDITKITVEGQNGEGEVYSFPWEMVWLSAHF